MERLLPALEGSGHLVTNYRGRRIPTGLGLVWLVWAAGVASVSAAGVVLQVIGLKSDVSPTGPLFPFLLSPIRSFASAQMLLLVVGACAFGLVDDVFGQGDAKGFRGHLTALRHGGITTGGLKLLGIGLLSAVAASASASFVEPMAMVPKGILGYVLPLSGWVVSTFVIGLSANLVNLTDLRPGRALKTYSALAVVATLAVAVVVGITYTRPGLEDMPRGSAIVLGAAMAITVLVMLLGPVFAVWRHDLGERAMLGDAGANAMGALAGFVFVTAAPLWLNVVALIVLLALNLASERVSFSRVIERVPALRWIDGLGRLPVGSESVDAGQDGDDGTRTGGSAAEGDDARRDGVS